MGHLLPIAMALFLVSSCSGGGGSGSTGGADFAIPALDGSTVRLSDHDGKVVLIDFWASWCAPCREMVPVLSKLFREYSDDGLVVLGISLDQTEPKTLGYLVQEWGIPYRILLGDEKILKVFGGVTSLPTLFIINREGRLVGKMLGYHSYRELEDQVKRYL